MRLSLRIVRKSLNIAFSSLNTTSSEFLFHRKPPSSSSTRSNFNTTTYFHQTVVGSRASKRSAASFPHNLTPKTPQSFAASPAVNTSSIQTEMSARTEHQSSSLAPTTTDSQSDHSNVAQLSMMTPRIPSPDARAPSGASGTTRHTIDTVVNQDDDPHKMQVVVSKAADARKPFKKKKEDPADENEEEDLRQFMKDRAKKPPSKKFEDHDSPFSFLTPDNKIVQQPSSRKLVDASSNLADDSAPVEINVEDMRKDIDDILFERQRSLQATSARRPGSVRGKTAALHRKTPSSASLGSSSQPQIGSMGNNIASKPQNTLFTFASSMRAQSQIGSNVSRSTSNSFASSSQKPGVYSTFASGSSAPFQPHIASAAPGPSQSQLGGNEARKHWISGQAPPLPLKGFLAPTSGSREPRSMGMSSAPKTLELYSFYIPPNAPTTQGMMPQRITSPRKQEVEVMQPTGQNTPRRPNREGKNNDSVQRSTPQPSNTAGGIPSWPPVRSRLSGNIITAPGPPQRTTEDVAMSSVSNFSTTTVERIVPNVSSTPPSASPLFEVQSPAGGQASSNPPKIASPHHASGDIAMHVVATIDIAEEGTLSSINPIPLPSALPPAVQPEDRESSSIPAITSAGVDLSFWDDMYEPMDSDDDQTVMGGIQNGTLTQDSTISQKAAPSPAADTISEVEAKPQANVLSENGASSYNQNVEIGIPNETSKATPCNQASAPVQVVSATSEVMPMETNVVLSTNSVEIAGVGVQEADIGNETVCGKNDLRVMEIGLAGGRGQDSPLNPLELFASVATSSNVDATLAQFREDKARRQAEGARNEVVSSRVEEHKQESQRMDVSAPGFSQSLEKVARPIPMDTLASVATATNAEFALVQFGEESMDFGISESNGRTREETMSLSEEPSSHSIDVGHQTEVSDSSKASLITLSSSQPPLQEVSTAIQTDDVDMSADERRTDSAPSSNSPTSNTSNVVGDENHIEMVSVPPTNPPALHILEVPNGSSIASSHPPMVEGAPVVHVSPASNARPPKTTSKASTTSKPLKPSAEPAVPPSSEEDRAKKAAIPSPSSKTPQKFTKNPGKSTKVASETPHDDPKLSRDVPKSTPTKSSKNSKAKSKDNMTTMNPPAVPGKRPEVASNTTKQIISDKKNEQPRSSNAPMSQKPKTESSVDKGNSAKVQGSPPTGEHIKPSKSKGNEKEKETSKYHPDNAPTKAADSPNSSSTTDIASKKEPTVAAKTSSPSPYFVPTRYSFAKDFAAPVPGESKKIDQDDDDPMQIDVESHLMDVDMDAGSNGNYFHNSDDVEMRECIEHSEQMKVGLVGAPVFPPRNLYDTFGTLHGLSSSTNYTAVPLSSNNEPLFPFSHAGLSSSQPSSVHLANNVSSGFSTGWNSYEPAFPQPQQFPFPQSQSFVAHDVPVPSMVHNPGPNPVEYVYNAQSPSPCLANNVGVIGFFGPALYDQGFQPGPPIVELPRNTCARYPEPLERPSLESLLRGNYQWKPQWKPFSESIPRYVEPVSYRRPDDLDTPSLEALLGDWKPAGITFSLPVTEVVEPVSEPTVQPLVTGDRWPVEERVPAWKGAPEMPDARVETTPAAPDGHPGRSSLERPVSDIGAATRTVAMEATNLLPMNPTATVRKPRKRSYYGPQGRAHPYPMHLRDRTAFGIAILIAQETRRKERQRSQLPPVEEPKGAPVDLEVETTQPLEITQPLETQPLETQPSEPKSWLKTTSDPTSKPKAKRRRIPGAWPGPLTPRTAGEERFYRFLSSLLRQIRQRVRTAFGEFDKVHNLKVTNRPSSKHGLRTRISA